MHSPTIADGAPINLDRLIESHLLIQANSGGGKSGLAEVDGATVRAGSALVEVA